MNGMSVTVIRGTGACDVVVNGILQEEFTRLNDMWTKEMVVVGAELQAAKKHRNKLLAEKLKKIKEMTDISRDGIKDSLIVAWATVWYLAEKWGLVVYEG